MKDVGLRIRIQRDLREQFLEACRAEDKPAAQVLREFIREYVNQYGTSSGDMPKKSPGRTKETLSRVSKKATRERTV